MRDEVAGRVGRWRTAGVLAGALLVGSTLLTACTQDPVTALRPASAAAPPEVGVVRSVPDDHLGDFLAELQHRGWVPGRDVRVHPDDGASTLADVTELEQVVRDWETNGPPDVIVAWSTPYGQLVAERLPDVPTVFVGNDPVAAGLVRDPRRPEGSVTGVAFRAPADRTLELGRRVLGEVDHVGYLWPLGDPAIDGHRLGVVAAGDRLGMQITEAAFDGPDGVAEAVERLARADVDLVLLASANGTANALPQLRTELDRHRLPAAANTDMVDFAVLRVTPDAREVRRQVGRQVARLLNGAAVSDVPVEEPRRFRVVVDDARVQDLGFPPVPPTVLRQADEVR